MADQSAALNGNLVTLGAIANKNDANNTSNAKSNSSHLVKKANVLAKKMSPLNASAIKSSGSNSAGKHQVRKSDNLVAKQQQQSN